MKTTSESLAKPSGPADAEAADKSLLLDLAYDEYCQLRDAGELVDPDRFCERFQTLKSSLGRLLRVHRFLEENSYLLADAPPVRWPAAGETFLGFTLLRLLGQGSFARVFLATEPALGGRLVAVKVSLQGAAEAETLGRLRHPNIVPIHSVQEEQASGLTVICMPYLGSATLCDVLDRAFAGPGLPQRARLILDAVENTVRLEPAADPQAPARVLRHGTYIDGVLHLTAQLADALAFIHALGICHRDLKPSNVLMVPDGRPMLLDFNLCADARAADARLGGTLPYMSPEQLRAADRAGGADPALLDARSDLFALGVIVYELLTGTHPFGPLPLGAGLQELRQLLLERQRNGPQPVRQGNPGIDKRLARLLERCLAYHPSDRPQSATELAAAFRKSLSPPRRTLRWASSHPRAAFGIVLLLLALSLAGFSFWAARDPYHVRQLKQGLEAYRHGQYTEAVQHYDQALEADPTQAQVLFARGRAYQQLGDIDEQNFRLAWADYERADKLAPDGRIQASLGYCMNRAGLPRMAILYYKRAIESQFAPAEVLNNVGCTYLDMGKLDAAQEPLDQAIELNPDLQAAIHNRALVCLNKALPLLGALHASAQNAGQKDSESRRAEADKEKIAEEMLRWAEKGIADIRTAIELEPVTADLYYTAARLCGIAARQDNRWITPALEYLTRAIEHGYDPRQLAADETLATLKDEPHFQTLTQKPVPSQPPRKAIRLVDPLRDRAE